MKTYRAANYQSSIAQLLEQPVPFWVSDDKISAQKKTSTSKGTFEEPANQWQRLSQIMLR